MPNGQFVDFANESFIIEHTIDHRRGVSEAIERLNSVPDEDERIRVLITKVERLGDTRLGRCAGIHLISLKAFHNGDIGFLLELDN